MRHFQYGDLDFYHVQFGTFRLDGGAMFGVVPKVLWERTYPADEKNRILLGMNVLFVQGERFLALVDNGVGSHLNPKMLAIYDIHWNSPLSSLSFSVHDVTLVLLTHLHFDHCGGSTVLDPRGRRLPAFPRATYFVQKEEWEDALNPNERSKASYIPELFLPLQELKVLRWVTGDDVLITPQIRCLKTPGHTRGHQIVLFHTTKGIVAFMGDLIPTTRHIPIPYIMAYDLFPLQTLQVRKEIYRRIVEEKWLLVFEHDETPRAGFLHESHGQFVFESFYPP